MFLGVGETEIGKNVAAADLVRRQGLLAHILAPFIALWRVSASRRRCRTRSRCRCGAAIPLVECMQDIQDSLESEPIDGAIGVTFEVVTNLQHAAAEALKGFGVCRMVTELR